MIFREKTTFSQNVLPMFGTTQGIPMSSEGPLAGRRGRFRARTGAPNGPGHRRGTLGKFHFYEILMGFHDFGGREEDPLKVA